MTRERRVLGRLLECAQALVRAARPGVSCWVVSRGACSVTPGERIDVSQSPVSGFVTTLQREHPAIRWGHLDLSGDAPVDARLLVRELEEGGIEPVVAHRRGLRYVKRLVRYRPLTSAGDPLHLTIGTRGALDTLSWSPAPSTEVAPGQVRIRVRASGLNFKDALNALGTLPEAVGPLGFECAGTIDAVGPGVHGLRAGEAVMAVASGALATHVIADARLVARKPAGWTFEEAAAFPVAFITAAFALQRVGRLQRGDRVLVHSAAGGVGLAAVRIALDAGAGVLATAGTDGKRQFLREKGVTAVFDSRSTTFAEGVLEATAGGGATVVLNALGGETIAASLQALASGGRFIEIGKKESWSRARMTAARPDVEYSVVDWSQTAADDPGVIGALLRDLVERYGQAPMPLPVTVYPPGEAIRAVRQLGSGRVIGKCVVDAPALQIAPSVRAEATYVVTGGLSGLGLATGRWLVDEGARQLVLVGRRAPDERTSSALEEMRAAGAVVRAVECDVADEPRLRDALDRALLDLPPLKGIVHAAGVLDNATLLHQRWETFDAVLRPKVAGAWALHRYACRADLDFFVLYSSIASVLGAPGQVNHAAANAFLDALAHDRRRTGLPALSIDWGVWSGIGAAVRSGMTDKALRDGIGLIEPAAGLDALRLALAQPLAQVVVMPADWSRFALSSDGGIASLVSLLAAKPAVTAPTATVQAPTVPAVGAAIRQAPAGRRRQLTLEYVTRTASRVLGFDSERLLDEQRPFNEMGLDSLMAVELRNLIARDVGVPLPATLVFDYPTSASLVEFLLGSLFPDAVVPRDGLARSQARSDGHAAPLDVLDRIEEMSDEDIDRLLDGRMGGART
jgi:polyketide synthase 12/myxalamid-type polyketide synthase MxaB